MGEMAEDAIMHAWGELDDEAEAAWDRVVATELPPRGIWQMRDGTRVRIADMEDRHLRNTIAMLERKGRTASSKFHELATELKRREHPLACDCGGGDRDWNGGCPHCGDLAL